MERSSSYLSLNTHEALLNLNHDILWYLFNVIIEDSHPSTMRVFQVDLLHIVSQVCTKWREVALSSPSLWGKTIHLEAFWRKTDKWRSELIRRTGQAPLYITDTGRFDDEFERMPEMSSFLLSLLDNNWHRIKSISIRMPGKLLCPKKPLGQIIARPFPILESFQIQEPFITAINTTRSIEDYPQISLEFQAPLLRKFVASYLRIPPHARWFSQLNIVYFASDLTGMELLHVLSSMPNVSDLTVAQSLREPVLSNSSESQGLATIHLPRLQYISGYGDNLFAAEFLYALERVVPGYNCSFALAIKETGIHSQLPTLVLDRINNIVHRILERTKEGFPLPVLQIIIPSTLKIKLQVPELVVDSHHLGNIPLMDPFQSPEAAFLLHHVTKLVLIIGGRRGSESELDVNLSGLFLRLNSVTSFETTAATFNFIHKGLNPKDMADTALPMHILEKLKFVWLQSELTYLFDFMYRRPKIKVLEFLRYLTIDMDLRFLEQIKGLEVIWLGQKDGGLRYICGSGSPDVLNFSNKVVVTHRIG